MSANKTELREKAKTLWLRGMKAIGNTAANIANNTRYKVDEVTIQNRSREVKNDLANKAYALWLKGESFPESMEKMLNELKRLDEQLNDIRAEKYAMSNRAEPDAARDAGITDEEEAEEETEDDITGPAEEESPVRAQINELFDGVSSVGKAAEKVNAGLEQMSDRIRNFRDADQTEESGNTQK